MIFFLIAMLLGVAAQTQALNFSGITPLFWHALMVGWITQIIMGVSMWMFPGRIKEESFQNQKWGWLTFGFLNLGLGLRLIAEPFLNISEAAVWNVLIGISAVFQLLGVISYVIGIWPRVMSKSRRRKKRRAGA